MHYHMSPAQFRRRTSMLGLPGEIYDRYDRIVKSCKVCSTSVPSPPRARIAGLRASSFGDLIFVDHAEINYGMNSYLVLLVIDGATSLLWATALTSLDAPETLGAFRLWIEENNCMPKGVVGDQAFFTDPFMDFYRFHGISPYPCGPRTPWPNRAETAVRLFKRAWVHMAKALTEEGYVDRVTVRQAVKKVVWARNCQLTVSGYSPLEIATGRRPPDLFDVETSTPEQLSAEPPEEDRTMLQLQRIALRAHQEARQALDLRKDIARRVMPSDGPYSLGDKVFVWMKDESKKKAEGIWVRGKVVSQEGAMVLVQVHKSVLRVNQSKVRRDHDPWHDVAIPLNSEPEVKEEGAPDRSQFSEGTGHHCSCCYEHEISHHTYTEKGSDFVEISASASGLTACTARSGMLAGVPILGEQFNMKKIQQSISQAWKTIVSNDPEHVFIHPVVPKQWNDKATKAFRKFCADVARWQDNRGCFVTIIYPRGEGFWSSQGCRALVWRHSFHSEDFSFAKDPKVWSLTLKSNLPEGTFGRLHSLDRFSGDDMSLDPRFVVLMTSCLSDQCVSDHRQECLFEDLLEDFDDGSLCALSLRSGRNYDALSAIPTKEEFSALGVDKGKLPKSLQFVSPQRFVTSSLVQALGEIDRLLPGTEMEIHTSTSKQALSLKPSLKSVRVLTLLHMEFEFCNVYRGTFGKTLPLLQRHPDAVVILWNPNDYDHVFFVTLSQLIPCLKQMNADHWSMIVFWSEGSRTRPSTGPDVGLDYTDEPVPLPPPNVPPPQDGTGNDDDMPGPSGYQDPVVPDEDMPYDDPGHDPPDLGGTGGGPFGPGPGPSGSQGVNDPDLPSGEIEFQYGPGGNPPPHYPGGGASVPVPDDSDSSMELIPDGVYGPSPDDDHPPYPMEVHTEPPLPGGPPDAPGAKQPFANPDQIMQPPPHVPQAAPQPIVPLPKHSHFPLPGVMRPPSPRNVPLTRSSGSHPDDTGPRAKLRFPSVGKKYRHR